ncbi:T9SS type A sorting domain-containing protein [Lacinutrix sp. MEBiC02595]
MKRITLLLSLIVLSIFNDIQAQSIATYTIVFSSTWNATDHTSIPPNDHWSRLVGTNHNSNVSFIEVGTMASQGIELIAESGTNAIFEDVDVQNAINAGNAEQYIYGPSLGSAAGTITISDLNVSSAFPILSLFTMVAPSPDWMMAIDDLELMDTSGNWKTSISIPMLYVYDAGTDAGTNYTSSNADVNTPISIFDGANAIAPFNGNSIGSLTVTLTNLLSVAEVNPLESLKIFPNPSTGNTTISNAPSIKNIEIYNILGSIVKSVLVENNSKIELNLNALSKGMYLVRLTDVSGNTKTQKLILE